MAIESFSCKRTCDFFVEGTVPRRCGWAGVVSVVARKFDMLHAAKTLDDLKVPPGNRLEALKGDLAGFHSVRVNDQWRIVFRWEGGAYETRIEDYH